MTFPRRKQGGFSLVELMVGVTIAIVAGMVIIQVMSVFEKQRRSTTGTADALTNGGIALFSIERDLQMAGFGLIPITNSALECTVVNINAGATGITGISPVTAVDGVAAAGVDASDSITIRYGTTQMAGVPTTINSFLPSTVPGAPAGSVDAAVKSNLGCSANDITLVNSGTTCTLSQAYAVSVAPAAPTVTVKDPTNVAPGANLACLGAWTEITYAVNQTTGNLDRTVRVNGTATTSPAVVGVVNLQVQYGIAASTSSNVITSWVNPSALTWSETAPNVANRNVIKAIRIAVVARNANMEQSNVSSACSSTVTAAPSGVCAWAGTVASPAPTVDLAPADANWARYRYRVFDTIVPLRNVIWSKSTL